MSNRYEFIMHKTGESVYSVISPNKVLPEIGQLIKVRYNFYKVVKVKEVIDYDNFTRFISIIIQPENQ